MNKKKLISLARCSTLNQAEEGRYGIQRQISAARQYAATHNLQFDEELSFKDLGKSGYKKKTLKTRALQVFIDNIQNHTIKNPHDYILCVEDMSRFSRRPPLETLSEIKKIVESGMEIHFLSKNKTFSEVNLQELPNFIELVFDSNTAYSESAKKSEYSNYLWSQLRKKAELGKPVHKGCVNWLKVVNGEWEVLKDRAETVKMIYKMYQDGIGVVSIARLLNDKKIPTFGKKALWGFSAINKILSHHAVYGAWQVRRIQKDESYKSTGEIIENYFPAIMDKETFMACRQIAKERDKRPGKGAGRQGRAKNLFTHLLFCASCGSTLTIRGSNIIDPAKYLYQVCTNAIQNRGCQSRGGVQFKLLEDRILWFIRDELRVEDMIGNANESSNEIVKLAEEIKKKELAYKELCDQIDGWFHATGKTKNDKILENLFRLIEKAEAEKIERQKAIEELHRQYHGMNNKKDTAESRIADVRTLIEKMQSETNEAKLYEIRVKLKAAISRVIDRMYIHPVSKSIAVMFKNSNAVRYILVENKKSGYQSAVVSGMHGIYSTIPEDIRKKLGVYGVVQFQNDLSEGEIEKYLMDNLR